MSETFASLGIDEWLQKSLHALKIDAPTPIQKACVPPTLKGRDVIGCAETGSGKTLAFGLPILNKLAKDPYGICALIMTPARELAIQISEQLQAVGKPMGVSVVTVIGGISYLDQSAALQRNPHIVVGTPGRCAQLVSQGAMRLKKLSFLVLDEADRLISQGFADDLKAIVGMCSPKRQTLLFSATMTSSLEVLQSISMRDPFRWSQNDALTDASFSTAATLRQEYVLVPDEIRDAYLVYLVRSYAASDVSMIIFANTVEATALYAHMLERLLDSPVVQLHSMLTQPERIRSLSDFRNGRARVLVASDVASRGLDIPMTDLVINTALPRQIPSYVHRVGRTARAGRSGVAVSLVSQAELRLLLEVEDAIGIKLTPHDAPEKEVLEYLREAKAARKMAEIWFEEKDRESKKQKK